MQAEGVPESDIVSFVQQFDQPVASHETSAPAEARPIATGGGRGTGLDVRKSDAWAKNNAPAIGAAVATAGTGGLAAIPAALAGGAIGAGLRGDDLQTSLTEGGTQGLIQAGGMGLAKLAGMVAKPLYRAAIPKNILDKFSKSDVAGQGLKSRTLLGTATGAETAAKANAAAGQGIKDAAGSVPGLSAQDIQGAFRPKYNKALTGGKIDRAKEIGAHVRTSMNEIGQQPMNGAAQLARKEFLEQEGKSAMTAANSNMAAVNPQLANIERRAIVQNLRTSPEMAQALNTSQAAIGVDRAAQATQNSSILNRLSHGGVWNAAKSPAGFSGAAITADMLKNMPIADVVRLIQMSQLGQDE